MSRLLSGGSCGGLPRQVGSTHVSFAGGAFEDRRAQLEALDDPLRREVAFSEFASDLLLLVNASQARCGKGDGVGEEQELEHDPSEEAVPRSLDSQ